MASESWLDSSLRRSSKLGQEVLEKAKRRSVSCSSTRPRSSPVFDHNEINSESEIFHSDLDHAFSKIVEYMSETTRQCKGSTNPEDFRIEVSPGTYSITAAMQDTKPQTKTVRINAEESMSLTFKL